MHSQARSQGALVVKKIEVKRRCSVDVRIVIRAKTEVDDKAVIAVIHRWLAQAIAKKIAEEMATAAPQGL